VKTKLEIEQEESCLTTHFPKQKWSMEEISRENLSSDKIYITNHIPP
jgi:hypothetical protein